MDYDRSYTEHNSQYRTSSDLAWHRAVYATADLNNHFSKFKFLSICERAASEGIAKHVDIGSGAGYLVSKTHPYFEEVIAVEPSESAIEISKALFGNLRKIKYVNSTMDGWLDNYEPTTPILVTTCAVLSHINNDLVQNFLLRLNEKMLTGSIVFLYEPYGKNIDVDLWHVRHTDWWCRHLPGCSMKFLGIRESGYSKGILAVKQATYQYRGRNPGMLYILFWKAQGVFYKLRYGALRGMRTRLTR